jgi:hypothetical protein
MRLLPAEKTIVIIILTLGIIDLALLALKPVRVDVIGYATVMAIAGSLFVAGQLYRVYRPQEPGIALATTGAALFTLFTIVGSVFNYMLLPLPFERIDETLVKIDAMLGYDWPSAVNWIANYPVSGEILRFVYASSLPQLILVVLILGFTCQEQRLHHFLLTGLLGALICIAIWSVFPSSGASGSNGALKGLTTNFQVMVSPHYNAEVNRIIAHGAEYVSPSSALGLIGFPSFHTVMACMSVCFMRHYRVLFVLFGAINLIMIPAVLIHGGHHLVDLIGGLVIFAIAAALARKAVEQAAVLRGGVPQAQVQVQTSVQVSA